MKEQKRNYDYLLKEHDSKLRELELKVKHEQELKNMEKQSKDESLNEITSSEVFLKLKKYL